MGKAYERDMIMYRDVMGRRLIIRFVVPAIAAQICSGSFY